MSEDAAQRFMAVAIRFGEIPQFAVFKPSVLYALAAPSTPDSVVEKAIEKAEAGESVIPTPLQYVLLGIPWGAEIPPHQKQETPTGAWLIGVFIWVWRNILRVTLSRQVALIWEPRKIIVLIFRGWTRLQVQPQELGALRDLLGRKTQRRKPQSRSVPFAL